MVSGSSIKLKDNKTYFCKKKLGKKNPLTLILLLTYESPTIFQRLQEHAYIFRFLKMDIYHLNGSGFERTGFVREKDTLHHC